LIRDEPTLGLDPTQIVEVRRLIRRLAARSTVLFSTHILSEVEALCDRAIILLNGRVRADARLGELAATPDAILVLETAPAGLRESLRAHPAVRAVEPWTSPDGYPAFRVQGRDRHGGDLCPALYRLARDQNWPLREVRRDVRTLETVFNELATAVEVAP
jgi:ABC-2 type transport system ATP-binding protein